MSEFVFRKNIDIGNLEAEHDTFLSSCFIETSAYESLLCFDSDNDTSLKRIVVGRTGSGKTALLKTVLNKIDAHDSIEAEKTVFDYIKNNIFISDLSEKKIDLKAFYKSLWVHVLLVKCIELTYKDSDGILSQNFLDKIKQFCDKNKKRRNCLEYATNYRENFFNDEVLSELSATIENKIKAKIGSSVLNAEVNAGSQEYQTIQSTTSHFVNQELLAKQKGIIEFLKDEGNTNRQRKVVISIDDLDKGWLSNSEIRLDFINGLLDAFIEFLNIGHVKILISIRSDILRGVYLHNQSRQYEKDKTFFLPIEWTKDEIRELLDKRINHLMQKKYSKKQNVTLKDLFDFEMPGTLADEYILKKTMLRPRDAIDFINICIEKADGKTKIEKNHLLEAEESYYSSRKTALVNEWTNLYKNISVYLDALAYVNRDKFTIDAVFSNKKHKRDFETLISDVECEILQSAKGGNYEKILKLWFEIGVIGIVKSESLVIYSGFDKQQLDITDLMSGVSFIRHPLFARC